MSVGSALPLDDLYLSMHFYLMTYIISAIDIALT